MKKPVLALLPGLVVLVFMNGRLPAQTVVSPVKTVEKCLQDYQDFSALGRSGSTFMDATTINAFRNLFEPDANLFWDLFKTGSHRISYLLTVDEYLDSARQIYAGKKPLLTYGRHRIDVNSKGKTAIAYLRKTLNIPEYKDSSGYKLNKTALNLRFLFNIRNDTVMIQNITEDTRLTRIRSIGFEVCYNFVNRISGGFLGDPVPAWEPGYAGSSSFSNEPGFSAALKIDIRLNRKNPDGLLVSTGLAWSRTNVSMNISNYSGTYRQAFDPGENSFEASVYDRSPAVSEKVTLTGFTLPLTVKWFVTHRVYLEAGPQVTLCYGKSQVNYTLSHTGGGKYILVKEPALPPEEQTWFYLDEQHEMDDSQYGFFRAREFDCSATPNLATVNVSAVIGAGFEARFKKCAVSVGPWITLGITSLTRKPAATEYSLNPAASHTGFLQTCVSPRLNSLGIRLIVSKMFYR